MPHVFQHPVLQEPEKQEFTYLFRSVYDIILISKIRQIFKTEGIIDNKTLTLRIYIRQPLVCVYSYLGVGCCLFFGWVFGDTLKLNK